jgi:RNA polymerase sigma-70 factor (ECF subfamily)
VLTVMNAVQDKTQELVMLAKEGDESALAQLCGAYAERIRRIIRLRMGAELRSKLESMDIVQDAMMAALRGLDRFTYRTEGDFLRWLCGIAENQIRGRLDQFHAAKRNIRREAPLDPGAAGTESRPRITAGLMVTTTPSVIFSRSEDLDRLERAMDALKPEYREVIVLAKVEGLSYQETAARLGKSPEAVGMLLSRAMLALIKAFERP